LFADPQRENKNRIFQPHKAKVWQSIPGYHRFIATHLLFLPTHLIIETNYGKLNIKDFLSIAYYSQ